MRTVYDGSTVAHLWGNQSQSEARNSGKTVHFSGPTLFSYAEPIARYADHGKKRCVLLTSRSFSITTTGHCSSAYAAIPNRETITKFRVLDLGGRYAPVDHECNWRSYLDRLEGVAKKIKSCRPANLDSYLTHFGELATEAEAYSKFFGLRKRLPSKDTAEFLEKFQDAKDKLHAAELRRALEARKRHDAELAERVERWKAGEQEWISSYSKCLLRVVGDELQTSQGARVPLDHAKKAFAMIAACKDKGREWERNGQQIHVGHFQVDRIESNGDIKAGCHRIEWAEIERIARQLNLLPV